MAEIRTLNRNLIPRACLVCILLLALFSPACGVGNQAPDFQIDTFSGEDFRLSDFTGKESLVVNFWYPSCPPCRHEMPHFETVWQGLKGQDIRFLGVFVPKGFDTENEAKDFVNELGLTFDFGTDRGSTVARAYNVQYFPHTFFINRDMEIVHEEISNLDVLSLTHLIERYLID